MSHAKVGRPRPQKLALGVIASQPRRSRILRRFNRYRNHKVKHKAHLLARHQLFPLLLSSSLVLYPRLTLDRLICPTSEASIQKRYVSYYHMLPLSHYHRVDASKPAPSNFVEIALSCTAFAIFNTSLSFRVTTSAPPPQLHHLSSTTSAPPPLPHPPRR